MAAAIRRRCTLMAAGFPDGPFPTGYGPVASPVTEGSVRLFALQPMRDEVERVFILRAYDRSGKLLGEKRPALAHDNRYGPDVDDLARLEGATDELLHELGVGGAARG